MGWRDDGAQAETKTVGFERLRGAGMFLLMN